MRASVAVVSVCLISSVAVAEEAPQEAPVQQPTEEAPTWSVGAGLGLGTVTVPLSGLSSLGVTNVLSSQANLTLERSLGAADWLMLDVLGSYSDQTTEADNSNGGSGYSRGVTAKAAGLLVGVRHVFTPGRAVEVSGWVGATGSWSQYETSYSPSTLSQGQTVRYRTLSAQAGLALDHEIVRGVYLRLALPIVEAVHGWGLVRQQGTADEDTTVSGFGLHLSPSIEIHMLI
jgi:hypothetical protein